MSGALRVIDLHLMSEEEFLALPETTERVELIDGEVVMSPSPTPLHQLVSGRLFWHLEAWARARRPMLVLSAPVDLRLGLGRIVQPDIALWGSTFDVRHRPVTELPLLVVEILSEDRQYDRMTKRLLYAAAGIPEYWIVDPEARFVEQLKGKGLHERAAFTDRIGSELLPGLDIDLSEVFDG